MKLKFHPEAEQEFVESAAYYEAQLPGLGERYAAEVRQAVVCSCNIRKLRLSSIPAFDVLFSVISHIP